MAKSHKRRNHFRWNPVAVGLTLAFVTIFVFFQNCSKLPHVKLLSSNLSPGSFVAPWLSPLRRVVGSVDIRSMQSQGDISSGSTQARLKQSKPTFSLIERAEAQAVSTTPAPGYSLSWGVYVLYLVDPGNLSKFLPTIADSSQGLAPKFASPDGSVVFDASIQGPFLDVTRKTPYTPGAGCQLINQSFVDNHIELAGYNLGQHLGQYACTVGFLANRSLSVAEKNLLFSNNNQSVYFYNYTPSGSTSPAGDYIRVKFYTQQGSQKVYDPAQADFYSFLFTLPDGLQNNSSLCRQSSFNQLRVSDLVSIQDWNTQISNLSAGGLHHDVHFKVKVKTPGCGNYPAVGTSKSDPDQVYAPFIGIDLHERGPTGSNYMIELLNLDYDNQKATNALVDISGKYDVLSVPTSLNPTLRDADNLNLNSSGLKGQFVGGIQRSYRVTVHYHAYYVGSDGSLQLSDLVYNYDDNTPPGSYPAATGPKIIAKNQRGTLPDQCDTSLYAYNFDPANTNQALPQNEFTCLDTDAYFCKVAGREFADIGHLIHRRSDMLPDLDLSGFFYKFGPFGCGDSNDLNQNGCIDDLPSHESGQVDPTVPGQLHCCSGLSPSQVIGNVANLNNAFVVMTGSYFICTQSPKCVPEYMSIPSLHLDSCCSGLIEQNGNCMPASSPTPTPTPPNLCLQLPNTTSIGCQVDASQNETCTCNVNTTPTPGSCTQYSCQINLNQPVGVPPSCPCLHFSDPAGTDLTKLKMAWIENGDKFSSDWAGGLVIAGWAYAFNPGDLVTFIWTDKTTNQQIRNAQQAAGNDANRTFYDAYKPTDDSHVYEVKVKIGSYQDVCTFGPVSQSTVKWCH